MTRSSLATGVVAAVHEDSNHVLWVGTNRGFSRFDAETESFRTNFRGERRSSEHRAESNRSVWHAGQMLSVRSLKIDQARSGLERETG